MGEEVMLEAVTEAQVFFKRFYNIGTLRCVRGSQVSAVALSCLAQHTHRLNYY